MNVLVINLTRLGDLLQSQAVLADLDAAGHNIDLVCLDNFANAASMLRHVRRVWPLPGAALLSKTETAWPEALRLLQGFVGEIREQSGPDCVFNLTPGAAPRLLTHYLAGSGTMVLGLGLDKFGFGLDHGVWASFVSVAARKRANSPFNLADMWRMMALPLTGGMADGCRLADVDAENMAWAGSFLNGKEPVPGGYIAFQLGASENRRRWPVAHFRSLGESLWRETQICPVLLGSHAEKHLAEEYASSAKHPFINAVGQTSLRQLAALLKRVRLLVTNDTGTMHLAAGLGIPSLAFFLATAQPWDTGPMLAGCCCLEPALPCHPCSYSAVCQSGEECRTRISADSVKRLIIPWLQTGQWTDHGITEARAWITASDTDGFYQLQALSANAHTGPGAWHAWWRVFWRQLFDHMANPTGPSTINFASLPPLEDQKCDPSLRQGATLLRAIAEMAPATAQNPHHLGKIFLRNCERLQDLWSSQEELSGLSAFWREFRSNQGGDLARFSGECMVMAQHMDALATAISRS